MGWAKLKRARYTFDFNYLRSVSLRTFLYSAYLTLKYVDEFDVFPTFQFRGRFKVKFEKDKSAQLIVKDRIILERWRDKRNTTLITLMKDAKVLVGGQFILGDGIKIFVRDGAQLSIKGRKNESGSGITGNSTVMVNESLEIGHDCIIAWDTYITDCDWHQIEGKPHTSPTKLHDKVWLGVGVKVLKGVELHEGCIVTSNSVVVRGEYPAKSMLTGLPAKVVKENIPDWHREMGQN